MLSKVPECTINELSQLNVTGGHMAPIDDKMPVLCITVFSSENRARVMLMHKNEVRDNMEGIRLLDDYAMASVAEPKKEEIQKLNTSLYTIK